ncbi:MAG: Methyltransferase domain protein [Syntrophorhabdus sp. PtaB.Bin027]|nr:MAG: Methyltransferase domain protein [Syntrophorhabdus sp. PtaB.Bin027]
MLILEIGVGNNKEIINSICVDIRKTPAVNILADARNLPFKNGSFDKIFSSHVIEHFSHTEIRYLLEE